MSFGKVHVKEGEWQVRDESGYLLGVFMTEMYANWFIDAYKENMTRLVGWPEKKQVWSPLH